MALVMGVDSSTQSCKVVITDAATGEVVRQGRAAHPDGTSVDPAAWWTALQDAIAAAGGLDDVEAWSIGGQQHGMVALDADGRVIRDALLWNDTRSAGAAADLIAEFGADDLAQRTGLVPVASFTITKLRWLRDHEPENAARVAAVALPHDWLTWRLRGFGPAGESERGPVLEELVTDRSDASGTGYWGEAPDGSEGYDRDLLIAALGHDAVLPHVLGPVEWVTDAAGRRVGPGAGDNAGAALGLGWEVLDPRVLDACTNVHRELFVPEGYRNLAFSDTCIAIGHGQFMMAPKVEGRVLQALAIEPTDRMLEIGTGSGFLTALLASLGAHVTSIEYFGDLAERAKNSLRRAGIGNIKLHVGDGLDGWPTAEPYDVIVATGSCPTRRPAIEQQLSINGRLFLVRGVAPVMEAILVTRLAKDTWTTESLFETELAPLIGAEAKAEFEF